MSVEVIQGDCRKVLATLPAASVDLTVTSPPYDNLRSYNGNVEQWGESAWREVIAELYRVTKDGGVVIWVVGDATINGSETGSSFKQALCAKKAGFRLHDTMIYQRYGIPQAAVRYAQRFEYMFVWSKGAPATFNPIHVPSKHAGKRRTATFRYPDGTTRPANTPGVIAATTIKGNVWDIPAGFGKSTLDREAYEHPAIFPEMLARDHILSWSNEGDTVLDPFAGSGTTGKMARQLGRRFIGIELEPSYAALARRRIAAAQPALKLAA